MDYGLAAGSVFGGIKITPSKLTELVQDQRRAVAFHEAGHAVVHWLLGEWVEEIRIDVNETTFLETTGSWGTTRCFKPPAEYEIPKALKQDASLARALAARYVVNDFAGPYVESKIRAQSDDWFDYLLEEQEDTDSPYTDCGRAQRVADLIYHGKLRRAWLYLRRLALWTEELFNDERVWAITAVLAAYLQKVDYLQGAEVHSLLTDAWKGPEHRSPGPKHSLGRNWIRRFRIRRYEYLRPNSEVVERL